MKIPDGHPVRCEESEQIPYAWNDGGPVKLSGDPGGQMFEFKIGFPRWVLIAINVIILGIIGLFAMWKRSGGAS